MRDQSRRITFTLFFNVVLALLVLTGIDPAQSVTSEKEEILRKCGEMFQQIADPKRTIFEVDRFHLLKVEFDDHDRLKELGIVPNYYYDDDHPEWRETAEFTNLTEKEFRQLKEVLAHIKDPGKLLRAASPVSAVTNMTAWHSETYEKATFRWGEVTDLRKGDDPPIEIR